MAVPPDPNCRPHGTFSSGTLTPPDSESAQTSRLGSTACGKRAVLVVWPVRRVCWTSPMAGCLFVDECELSVQFAFPAAIGQASGPAGQHDSSFVAAPIADWLTEARRMGFFAQSPPPCAGGTICPRRDT